MIRNIVAVIAGVIAAGIVVALVEGAGHALFPPPPGVDVSKPEGLASIMDKIPLGAKLSVVVAWGLGSLAGGCTAAWLAVSRRRLMASIVGVVVLALGLYSLVTIPHPMWMTAMGVALPVPMAWLGSRFKRN